MAEILFSVTANDCIWSYTKGTGAGGQKRNKTSSAVHCKHPPSGAHGYSEASRSQLDNKRDAFVKMTQTKEFKDWHKMETMRRNGQMAVIDSNVQKELRRIKVEVKQDGKWVEVPKNMELPSTPAA
jgi:protein subunit release factor B